jgi:hypothetical protein
MAFHLPGIAGWLERRLARAQEMAADAIAAEAVGSRERVAAALVHVARARIRLPSLVLPFSTADLEFRVHRLLFSKKELDFPRPLLVLVVGIALGGLIAASADAVHHAVEIALGFVAGD